MFIWLFFFFLFFFIALWLLLRGVFTFAFLAFFLSFVFLRLTTASRHHSRYDSRESVAIGVRLGLAWWRVRARSVFSLILFFLSTFIFILFFVPPCCGGCRHPPLVSSVGRWRLGLKPHALVAAQG